MFSGQPSARQTPVFQSWPRGTRGQAGDADGGRLHRLPDVDVRVADDQGVVAGDRLRRCGTPSSRAPGGRPGRRGGRPGPGRTPRRSPGGRRRPPGTPRPRPRCAGRRPRPARPARRRAGPRRRCARRGPPGRAPRGRRPSRRPYGWGEPGAAAGGADQGHHPALQQEAARLQREHPVLAEAVLQGDRRPSGLLAADHRAAEAGGRLLDHQVRARRAPRARAWASSTAGSGRGSTGAFG